MRGARLPRHTFEVVGAVGNGNDHAVAVECGGLPQVVGSSGHNLAITFEGRSRRRGDATAVEDNGPVPRLSVLRLEVVGVFEADHKRGGGDGIGTIIAVCTRGETRNGERDRSKEAQSHQEVHRPTASREPPRAEGRTSPSVLHNGSP